MLRRRRTIKTALGLTLLSMLSIAPAAAAEPPAEPILRIEAGMHTSPIKRIGVDAAERYLVTASDDKTARIWDLNSGELLRILRPPVGAGDEGKLYAVALSPDGDTVAVGGWTKAGQSFHNIYLFERASGKLLQRISGLPNVINHLAYSHDGRYLAAALGENNGIRVFDAGSYREVFSDKDYFVRRRYRRGG